MHGLAGVGKSTLVQAFANEARDRGATVLHLDCRAIEPTERGFLSALADATGVASPSPTEAAARLDSLGERVVLVLDTYEVFRLFDSWLQRAFVPSLSDHVRVVLSGREPPMTGWQSTFGPLFRDLPLGRLVERGRRGAAASVPRRPGRRRADQPRSRVATRSRCDSRPPRCRTDRT